MRRFLARRSPSRCKHPNTIVVRSVGMERVVCESCGHLSFAFAPEVVDVIDHDLVTTGTDQASTSEA